MCRTLIMPMTMTTTSIVTHPAAPITSFLWIDEPGSVTLLDTLQPWVGTEGAADFGARIPFDPHDVGGEVEAPLEEARPHAVHSHRNAFIFELSDLLDAEAAGDDDLHPLEALAVERPAHVPDELRVDAGGLEETHLRHDGAVDQRLRGVEPHAVEALPQSPRHGERRFHAVVFEIDERDETDLRIHELRELERRLDGVAVVGGDQGMRHRADPLRAPPRRLGVGRHADRPGDVGGVAVA